ncbi:hypothetical protein BASA50_003637 [Batrachochytrium salamandrivorans]|uniref:Uncharacterized protein n=1 Tax=Batrachochytrium salamandrivorans TaxID=1357716 RepID=A0ABQ8FJ89_9FUNG|nr:hypothetical protein BASA62_007256 [Batrachochytrium salamandrivorans]KAH6569894.1 hypothetical protein BASA60_008091 [Batrachochytrium salamandrivorans]KAH6598599.1 hypothetical protein BASA50_003637 [Batrachochytrium salamandrivorans]
MSQAIRTPTTVLDSPNDLHLNNMGGNDRSPSYGEHTIKMTIMVDYKLCCVDPANHSGAPMARKARQKKRPSGDTYRRLYITYSLGGQIEGKTEIFSISGNNWSAVHELIVTTEFITSLYHKQPEFVIWEIVSTDDHDKEFPKSSSRRVANIGATNAIHSTISTCKMDNESNLDHSSEKVPISLVQTLIKNKPRHSHKTLECQSVITEQEHCRKSGYSIPSDLQTGPVSNVTIKANRVSQPHTHNDFIWARHAQTDDIRHHLTRHQSLSTPDLSAVLRQGIHEPKSTVQKRPNSHSPPPDRLRPGSPLHRFLNDDFGVSSVAVGRQGQHQGGNGGARAVSRASSRETAHPHHFNHPEKHVAVAWHHRELSRSRSSSSLASLHQTHTKTPPSPHHHDHPLTILAPFGRVKGPQYSKETDSIRVPQQKRHSKVKDNVEAVGGTIQNMMLQTLERPNATHPTTAGKRIAFCPQNAANDRSILEEQRHIRWDSGGHIPGQSTNWLEMSPEDSERHVNDQRIDRPTEKLYPDKRKGEYTHVAIGKVVLDIARLYFDVLEVKEGVGSSVDGLEKCNVSLKLDCPLLSEDQAIRLNPMCITIDSVNGMPNRPVSYSSLDETCLPVKAIFRMINDSIVHSSTIINQPRGSCMTFDSHHLILAGLIDASRLHDEILKFPLLIEIHDRDYQLPKDLEKITKDLRNDGLISQSANPINPYGVASFSLLNLYTEETEFHLSSPILPAPMKATKSKTMMSSGLWLESSASLSISLRIRFSLKPKVKSDITSSVDAPFGHIIIVTSSINDLAAKTVHDIVTRCNADELKLSKTDRHPHLLLKTHQLSKEQRNSNTLDILTGYDIFDREFRVMFIEGLIGGHIQTLLRELDSLNKSRPLSVFHFPMTTFSHPCYSRRLPTIVHIRMEPDILQILGNTSTYIKGRISKNCSDCLFMIHKIIDSESIPNKTMSPIFPTQKMILGLLESVGNVVQFEESLLTKVPPAVSTPRLTLSPLFALSADSETPTTEVAIKLNPTRTGNYGRRGKPINHSLGYVAVENKAALIVNNNEKIKRLDIRSSQKQSLEENEVHQVRPRDPISSHNLSHYSACIHSATQQKGYDLHTSVEKARDRSVCYASYCESKFPETAPPANCESGNRARHIVSKRHWNTPKGFWEG